MNKKYLYIITLFIFIISLKTVTASYYTCYQESANVSNQSGTDGNCNLTYTGKYSTSGTWGNPSPVTAIYDGYWGENPSTGWYSSEANDLPPAIVYINYTSPPNVKNATWSVKFNYSDSFTASSTYNYDLPTACTNRTTTELQIYEKINNTAPNVNITLYCYNGGTWQTLFSQLAVASPHAYVYEEGITWTVRNWSMYTTTFPYANNAYTNNNTLTYGITTTDPYYNHTTYTINKWNGTSFVNTVEGICYQESANVSNQAGTDGMCNLKYNGTYSYSGSISSPTQCYDGIWGTSGGCMGNRDGYIFINYTKPTDYNINSASWRTSQAGNAFTYNANYTIPTSCLQQPNLQLRINLNNTDLVMSLSGYANGTCYNGTSWIDVFYRHSTINYVFQEEGIYWNVTYANMTTNNTSLTNTLADGKYYYALTVYDSLGNSNYYDPNITIDTTYPVPTIQSPLNNTPYYNDSIKMNITVTEINFNYTTITIKNNGNGATEYTHTNTSNNFTQYYTLNEGNYNLTLTSCDLAGNCANTTAINWTIDNKKTFNFYDGDYNTLITDRTITLNDTTNNKIYTTTNGTIIFNITSVNTNITFSTTSGYASKTQSYTFSTATDEYNITFNRNLVITFSEATNATVKQESLLTGELNYTNVTTITINLSNYELEKYIYIFFAENQQYLIKNTQGEIENKSLYVQDLDTSTSINVISTGTQVEQAKIEVYIRNGMLGGDRKLIFATLTEDNGYADLLISSGIQQYTLVVSKDGYITTTVEKVFISGSTLVPTINLVKEDTGVGILAPYTDCWVYGTIRSCEVGVYTENSGQEVFINWTGNNSYTGNTTENSTTDGLTIATIIVNTTTQPVYTCARVTTTEGIKDLGCAVFRLYTTIDTSIPNEDFYDGNVTIGEDETVDSTEEGLIIFSVIILLGLLIFYAILETYIQGLGMITTAILSLLIGFEYHYVWIGVGLFIIIYLLSVKFRKIYTT